LQRAFAPITTEKKLTISRPVKTDLLPNTLDFESEPFVKATGFREYDARWLFEKEINLYGIQAIGRGLGTLIHERGVRPDIVVAHILLRSKMH
jgi:hypothetical protein